MSPLHSSLRFTSWQYFFTIHIWYIFLMYSSIDGHLGWFHNLAIVNSATVNMGVQGSLLYVDLDSFGYVLRSSMAGSYSSSIFSDFQSGSTNFTAPFSNSQFLYPTWIYLSYSFWEISLILSQYLILF
jgi:hypothetical protein